MTTVVNMKYEEYDVRIDRQTKWGNPYVLKRESDREYILQQYATWLKRKIKNGEYTIEELAELYGKRLGCHCAPKSCHGDILKIAVEWAYHERK